MRAPGTYPISRVSRHSHASSVKWSGDERFAGLEVVDRELIVETESPVGERVIDTIRSSVRAAWECPSDWQVETDRILRWFSPLVIVATTATSAH